MAEMGLYTYTQLNQPSKKISIAIYSGTIPSTTFIERLIVGLANSDCDIYLFGNLEVQPFYKNNNIRVYANKKGLNGFLQTIYRFLLLGVKSPKTLKILKHQSGGYIFKNRTTFKQWQKYLPVILHPHDIFHIQWAKSLKDWLFLKEQFGTKIFISLRGTHINLSPIADISLANEYKALFPIVDGFQGVSKAIIKEAIKYGAEPSRCKVIYSGLDLETFKFISNNHVTQKIKLLSVGRSHWVKGYSLAIDAIKKLHLKGIEIEYTIIGGYCEELIFQVNELGLNNIVSLKNAIPNARVIDEIKNSTILFLPSHEEGIANVVLEAMALGTLVISSDCGGMPEVVIDGETGFLFKKRTLDDLCIVLQKACSIKDDVYKTITKQAREKIEMQHSEAIMVNEFILFYKNRINSF